MNHNWYAGNDQFFFCREKIDTLDRFAGKKTRNHSAALSDLTNGIGATAQFLAFAEAYTPLTVRAWTAEARERNPDSGSAGTRGQITSSARC